METTTTSNSYVNIFKIIFVILTIILQISLFIFATIRFNEYANYFTRAFQIFSIILAIRIICSYESTSYKMSWVLFILIAPITGLFLYLIFGKTRFAKTLRKNIVEVRSDSQAFLNQDEQVFNLIDDECVRSECKLIKNMAGYPVYKNTKAEYLYIGEKYFDALISEIEKAEKFVFLEYFIVTEGVMHRRLMKALSDKANSGVDVRYIYDAGGSQMTVPKNFKKECAENNIKCLPFNPFTSNIYSYASYRSHRKITVIDGNVGFTGGINIGDEYINESHPLGHWKDMGVKLTGDAVWSLTVMFLDGWRLVSGEKPNYENFRPTLSCPDASGFVAPFDDAPLDDKNPAQSNYERIISNAKDYIYITTPYLIIESEMSSRLILAAQSGVDVRIITPHIPDKRIIYEATRSHYAELLRAGVRIYEYTTGFVHGKVLVTDDRTSFVGSINFDYRSLTWNYECGAYINDKDFALSVKADMLNTISISGEIPSDSWAKRSIVERVFQSIIKIICPLL